MATDHPGRKGRPRRRLLAQVRAVGAPCWFCGQPIDLSVDPQRHPLRFTLHEIIPVSRGGSAVDPTNVVPAHLTCNASAGNRPVTNKVRARCLELYRRHAAQPTLSGRGSRSW